MATRVLVVDDAAFMRMMVKDILSKNGYEIVGEAVKEIKKVDPGAKVVMCSAMGQQAMVIEAIQAGARDFIVKPFQADRVLEAIRKAVG